MGFFKRLFKSEKKVLASTTINQTPLNEIGKNEKVRKTLINYLISKHGEKLAQKIINNSNYGIDNKLLSGSQLISIYTKDNQFYGAFIINDNKIEELETVDPSSKEGKSLYK